MKRHAAFLRPAASGAVISRSLNKEAEEAEHVRCPRVKLLLADVRLRKSSIGNDEGEEGEIGCGGARRRPGALLPRTDREPEPDRAAAGLQEAQQEALQVREERYECGTFPSYGSVRVRLGPGWTRTVLSVFVFQPPE